MDAYIYRADLHCERCGVALCADLPKPAGFDPTNESTWDSGDYPKGPYPAGGGEADCPQHCGSCGVFLENPLTDEGCQYIYRCIGEAHDFPRREEPYLTEWRAFYGMED